jgi:DNA-binding CsgD family transcriptional regulator
VLGLVARHAGVDDDALDALAMSGAPEGAQAPVIGAAAHAAGLALAGRHAEAESLYRSLGPVAAWRVPPHVELLAATMALDVALELGTEPDIGVLHGRLAAYRGYHVVSGTGAFGYNGPVELWTGRAALALGRPDEAVSDLETATRACAVNGATGFRVEAQAELATALAARAARGDAPRALALATEAARQARLLGLDRLAARATAAAGRPGAGLTRRELEVAHLVAAGLTNREIAQRLHLSERTAQNHVQHVLDKLGLPNRSQIAVWVSRRT